MTILELMKDLTSASTISEAATLSINSGIAGAKDIYLAWGKERGDTAKDLNEAWKEAQPQKAKRAAGGFAADYYNWLAEDARSEADAKAFIMGESEEYGETTNNVKNHLTHYLNIWALAETVRSGETVLRSVSGGSTAKKATGTSKKAKAEPEPEQERNAKKELISLFAKIAKGEFKTITLIRQHLSNFDKEGLEQNELDKLSALQEFVDAKGIKPADAQTEALKIMKA